ncbi:hypothetical protein [Amphibacillus indicireducens]|uniref:Small, acid-soluble spore protein gamma-type n=1 Tax=Amphibacillus indicireducens TaxID=1076330 RepID=A0ABP7VBF2_9BACI
MNQNQSANNQTEASKKANKTNPEKVKQEIKKDLSQGQGTITSREAGHMRD